jgi:hypothetical protein
MRNATPYSAIFTCINNNTLRAESVGVLGAGLSDSLEIAVDSTTPAPPPSSDGWHNINNPPRVALRLPLTEHRASTSNSIHPHTPSSSLSSEPLHYSMGIEGSRHARSEATTPSSSVPRIIASVTREQAHSKGPSLYQSSPSRRTRIVWPYTRHFPY